MEAAEFESAGLYDPAAPGAAARLALLQWLVELGVPLEQMQQANARGQLPYVASTNALRPGPYLTQQELADRLGVRKELIEAFRVAFALPPVPADSPWCNDAEARMFESVAGGVGLFGEVGMLRLSRVLGSSVSRIAEAMASTNAERMRTLADGGADEFEIARANLLAVQTADAPARIMTGLLSLHLQIASTRLRQGRSNSPDKDTVYGCVGFVDLVGSTTLSQRLSSRDLAAMVDRFEEVAHDVAVNRRGRVVKFIGDEVMFVTGDADSACDIALTLVERFAGDPAVTPRGGLAEGFLLDRCGDYYGPVVNLAARLGELAVPNEILVTTGVSSRLRSHGLRCEAAGRRSLRGFEEPVSLMTVARA